MADIADSFDEGIEGSGCGFVINRIAIPIIMIEVKAAKVKYGEEQLRS